jgi:hypothetical protein
LPVPNKKWHIAPPRNACEREHALGLPDGDGAPLEPADVAVTPAPFEPVDVPVSAAPLEAVAAFPPLEPAAPLVEAISPLALPDTLPELIDGAFVELPQPTTTPQTSASAPLTR